MRSTLAFAAGMLAGFLLAWASGTTLAQCDWPATVQARVHAGILSAFTSMHDGLAAVIRPSGKPVPPPAMRRPVTRVLRMARTGLTLSTFVSPDATIFHASSVVSAALQAAKDVDSNASLAPRPEPSAAAGGEQGLSGAKAGATGETADSRKIVGPRKVSIQKVQDGTPAQEYARALESYQAGRHALAREQFAAFMKSFPGHPLVPNALYWIGETWYAQARYERASRFFAQVVQDHPVHAKSADALLKLAYSAMRQGRLEQARAYLTQLEVRYPDSQAWRLGRQARSRMQGQSGSGAQVLARG